MDNIEAKQRILTLINKAEELTPQVFEDNLPSKKDLLGEPEWHFYEHEIWKLGEEIRQILLSNKPLKKDNELIERIIKICTNRNSKRGRQSFIMLLWSKDYSKYADKLISQLNDRFVYGHVIESLNKMKVEGFSKIIKPYCEDKVTWIRNQAIKYINQHST